jgi:ribonuclease HI
MKGDEYIMKEILKWKNGKMNTRFFLPDTVNIFTDASVDSTNGMACLALAIVYTDIDGIDRVITRPSTKMTGIPYSFEGEWLALMNGVFSYIKYAKEHNSSRPMHINAFTDSLSVVQAVRKKRRDLIGVDMDTYKPATLIDSTAVMCKENAISVYHVKGHLKKIKDIRKKFSQHNGIGISKYDAFQLLKYNNLVDVDANVHLRSDIENIRIHDANDIQLLDEHGDNE